MTAFRWVWSDDPMERTRTPHRSRRRAAALLAAIGLVVSACGSDTTDTTTANTPAGAKENAVGDAVCYDWPAGTIAKPCAIHLKGPGGGRIFYDAGTPQPWGRFLEVAPQKWNPTLGGKLYECPGSGLIGSTCGSADEAKWPKATGDGGESESGKTEDPAFGYVMCPGINPNGGSMPDEELQAAVSKGLYVETGAAIGDGRANTDFASNWQRCTGDFTTASMVAKGYRDGSQNDWYLPSIEELLELCRYTKRSGIGGFVDAKKHLYLSSTLNIRNLPGKFWNYVAETVRMDSSCTMSSPFHIIVNGDGEGWYWWQRVGMVRPIRAF